ncbi:hypothetical protein CDAR_308581 [Caerostris darwini]|uniref:Uncharacterized protein n=1 Tax=Caerostris darwini TaxID=1538125 RepID=A0AAV4VCU2_9ARAC|nr:hypothetical protein CDAR_308581 [Caerostris darwini]
MSQHVKLSQVETQLFLLATALCANFGNYLHIVIPLIDFRFPFQLQNGIFRVPTYLSVDWQFQVGPFSCKALGFYIKRKYQMKAQAGLAKEDIAAV